MTLSEKFYDIRIRETSPANFSFRRKIFQALQRSAVILNEISYLSSPTFPVTPVMKRES